MCGPGGDPVDQVGLGVDDPLGGECPDVLGHVPPIQQRTACGDGSGGEVLDQLAPHHRVGHHVRSGDDPLDLAADVRGVPRRAPRTQPGQGEVGDRGPVDPPHRRRSQRHLRHRWPEAEVMELLAPPRGELGAVLRDDLVGSGVCPRASVPRAPQRWAGFLAGVIGPPLGLVPVDVAADLRRSLAELTGVRRQLADLAGVGVEGVPVCGEARAEPGVTHHRRVPDPVDRLDAVHHADRVQTPPPTPGEDAGVDLQVKVTVRVTRAGGVVPHHRGLEPLHRDLDLPPARAHPGGGVLGQPPDDLDRRRLLRRVVRRRDLGMNRRRQRPGLRPVHHHLDEPQPVLIGAEPALRPTLGVEAGDPRLVGVPVQGPPFPNHRKVESPHAR